MPDISHVVTISWSENNAGLLQKAVTLTGQEEHNLAFSLAGTTTNQQHTLAIDISQLQSLFIWSDQTVTIKTNSTGSPQETITITADKPLVWYAGCGVAIGSIFAGDVTTTYWTNGGATAASVYVKALEVSP